jgi:release factor glutamine methyltransferase
MYEPREDSFLIAKHIKDFCNKSPIFNVLDMGTGSGILALEASRYCNHVTAVDIDKDVVKLLKQRRINVNKAHQSTNNRYLSIKFIHSNLFSNIKKAKTKFDLIIFNPPYLPSRKSTFKHIDLDGGLHGTEIIERFLKDARKFLKKDGKILLLTSSLNRGILLLFKKYNLSYKIIDQENFFFEKLYVWILD